MGQTPIEKIVQRFAVGLKSGRWVRAGEYVTIRHVMSHDNTGAVIPKSLAIAGRGWEGAGSAPAGLRDRS